MKTDEHVWDIKSAEMFNQDTHLKQQSVRRRSNQTWANDDNWQDKDCVQILPKRIDHDHK